MIIRINLDHTKNLINVLGLDLYSNNDLQLEVEVEVTEFDICNDSFDYDYGSISSTHKEPDYATCEDFILKVYGNDCFQTLSDNDYNVLKNYLQEYFSWELQEIAQQQYEG